MAERGLPGMSIGIVHDQELIWARGFGFSDNEKKSPATAKTIYRMASNTKLFTATAIMQLRDRGKLQLDDPVVKHLPWFRFRNRHPDAPTVTIRHLLTHTSGLPREAAFPYWTDYQFPTREQIVQTLSSQESVFPPETQWKYSNLALTLAGEIVAAVSGESYAAYIHKHILDPVGMTSTSVILPQEHKIRLATGYGRRMPDGTRKIMPFSDIKGLTPAGNLSSTVEDFARFVSLQFRDGKAGGNQILKGSTLREMHRVHWLQPDWKRGWGLGFHVWRQGERVLIGHGGSLPGYRTQTTLSPEEKIAVMVMTNADDGDPAHYVNQALELVAPAIVKAAAPPAKVKRADTLWEKYAGKYRSVSGVESQVLILNGELVLFSPTTLDPKGSLAKLVPETEHTFRLSGEDGYMALGEPVRFEFGPDGKIARMKIGENYSSRQN